MDRQVVLFIQPGTVFLTWVNFKDLVSVIVIGWVVLVQGHVFARFQRTSYVDTIGFAAQGSGRNHPAARIVVTLLFHVHFDALFVAHTLLEGITGFGQGRHTCAETNLVKPGTGSSIITQFDQSLSVVEDGFCVAQSRPWNLLPSILVNNGWVWINKLAYIITRVATIPVFHRALTRIQTEVWHFAGTIHHFVSTRLNLVGWIF